jgi:hypothetical protein
MARYDLFISYHTLDHNTVDILREFLGARGLSSFLDRKRLVSPPYTFFLLNDDMELNRNRQFLV